MLGVGIDFKYGYWTFEIVITNPDTPGDIIKIFIGVLHSTFLRTANMRDK